MRLQNYLPGLLAASVPFAGWSVFNIGQTFSFTASYVICTFAIIVVFMNRLMGKTGGVRTAPEYFAFAVPMFVACNASFIPLVFYRYANFSQFIASNVHLLFYIVSLWALLHTRDIMRSLRWFSNAYVVTAVFVGIIGIYELYLLITTGTGLGIEFNATAREAPAAAKFSLLPRISSVFFEPGWFAHYSLVGLVLIATWMYPEAKAEGSTARQRWLAAAGLALAIAVAITMSASAFVVGGAMLLFVVFTKPRPFRTLAWVFGALVLLSLIPLPYDLPNPLSVIMDRFLGLASGNWVSGESADSRTAELEAAMHLFFDSNLFGVGYGQSANYVTTIEPVGTGGISSFYGILLAETGLFGFLLVVASFLYLHYVLYRVQKNYPVSTPFGRILYGARCVFFADTLFLNFFGNFASAKYTCSLWLVLVVLRFSKVAGQAPRRAAV